MLSDGTRITDTILGRCADPRPGPALVTCSKVGPKRRVPACLDLVALVATDPATPWRSVVVGAPEGGKGRTSIELVARGDTETDRQRLALHALEVAVDCYRRGMLEPIPLFTTVSYKLHRRCVKPDDWQAFGGGGEGQDEANRLVFGDLSLSELRALRPARATPAGPATRASRALRRLPVGRHRDEHRGELLSSPSVFSLLGPLPEGRVAIEASAGTGKTYTLAGLVVRYVAEADIPLDKLLIVTFTRAAAAELRDRVRTRLDRGRGGAQQQRGGGGARRTSFFRGKHRPPAPPRTSRASLGRLRCCHDHDHPRLRPAGPLHLGLGGSGRSRRHAPRRHARAPLLGVC